MRRKPPCYGCDRRTLGCHSMCKQYREWKFFEITKKVNIKSAKEKEELYSTYQGKSFANPYSSRCI